MSRARHVAVWSVAVWAFASPAGAQVDSTLAQDGIYDRLFIGA